MITSLQDNKLSKFNITEIPVVEFTPDQHKDNCIEIPMPRKLRFQMTKYRLENGMRDTPEINVKSPTGKIRLFTNPYSFASGVVYTHIEKKRIIKLRLIN